MFLTNRKGVYYLNYLDTLTGTYKRLSTSTKIEREAYRFLELFAQQNQINQNLSSIKLSSFRNEYINYLSKTHSPKYISSIELTFRKITESIGDIPLDKINSKIIEEFIASTFIKSQAAASLYYRTFKAVLNKAVSWEYISVNPLIKVKLPKMRKKYPQFISSKEFEEILFHTRTEMLQDIFKIAFHTGMRLGEIVNMKWSWIDQSNKLIKVKVSNEFVTKSKKERSIPMNSIIVETISKLRSKETGNLKDNFLFHIKFSAKLNGDYISKNFKKAVRKTSLSQDIHFHSLRHSFASNLVQKGASIFVCKELLGHEDIKTTMIYSHLRYQNLVDAVSLLE